jgi:U3 small nucleolar RNA-associated protein 21
LGDFDDEVKTLLGLFFQFIEDEMATRRHFQVFQAYLNRFLKLYEQLVVANDDLLVRVESLCAVQQHKWDHVQQLLHNNLCLVQYFSKIQM